MRLTILLGACALALTCAPAFAADDAKTQAPADAKSTAADQKSGDQDKASTATAATATEAPASATTAGTAKAGDQKKPVKGADANADPEKR